MMVDQDLIENIRSTLPGTDIVELDQAVADRIAAEAASRYSVDTRKKYWWAAMGVSASKYTYNGQDGLRQIETLVGGNPQVILYVTDDELPPWPAFQGSLRDILALIGEQRFFEYFIISRDCEWIIFDTHENSLVVARK